MLRRIRAVSNLSRSLSKTQELGYPVKTCPTYSSASIAVIRVGRRPAPGWGSVLPGRSPGPMPGTSPSPVSLAKAVHLRLSCRKMNQSRLISLSVDRLIGLLVDRLIGLLDFSSSQKSYTLNERKSRGPQLQGVQGRGCSCLPRTLGNAEDGVASAFPKGKQNGI